MLIKLLKRSGTVEVFVRKILSVLSPIKKTIKRKIRNKEKQKIVISKNTNLIQKVRCILSNCGIKAEDIIIIHSSLDGLRSLGLTAEEIIDLLLDIYSECTLVFPTYPIESSKKKDVYKYDPQKTLCSTGILPNEFLKKENVIRSRFPYNSLSAIGKHAAMMMNEDLLSRKPHDVHSAWEYCRQHHAKILFFGITSREANTMAIHMIPDIMMDKWPIKDWYQKRNYIISMNEGNIEKQIEIQKGFWYQYVNEYKTDYYLKTCGLLRNISVGNIQIEIVDDSYEMIKKLIYKCEKGKLMYKIPKKFYNKKAN